MKLEDYHECMIVGRPWGMIGTFSIEAWPKILFLPPDRIAMPCLRSEFGGEEGEEVFGAALFEAMPPGKDGDWPAPYGERGQFLRIIPNEEVVRVLNLVVHPTYKRLMGCLEDREVNLPMFVDVEFAGLGGVFEPYNGMHRLIYRCWPHSTSWGTWPDEPYHVRWMHREWDAGQYMGDRRQVSLSQVWNGSPFFYARLVAPYEFGVSGKNIGFQRFDPDMDDLEGSYTLLWCWDDGDGSCAASAGATCKARYTGATWP